MRGKFKSLAGKRFGRLTVECYVGRAESHPINLCRCDCGNIKRVRSEALLRGATRSCGCLQREYAQSGKARLRHGHSVGGRVTPEYKPWECLNVRCRNPRHPDYKDYGGRGIKIEFASFEEFLAYVDPKPTVQHSIDRIDVNGNYAVGNVRWATSKEQQANRRPRSEWRRAA